MKKRITTFIQIFLLILFLFAYQANTQKKEMPDLESLLKTQIDIKGDEYLEWYSENGDYMEILKLDTIHYASFTKKNKPEIFAIFKVLGMPHVSGLDRTIAAIYDEKTLKIITQRTFTADRVSIYFLPVGYNMAFEDILFIGSVSYQGHTDYIAQLYTLKSGDWQPLAMPIEDIDNSLVYAVTNNKLLHTFELSYDEYSPVYTHKETFDWSIETEEFIKTHSSP